MQQHNDHWISWNAIPGLPYTTYWNPSGAVLFQRDNGAVVELVPFNLHSCEEVVSASLGRILIKPIGLKHSANLFQTHSWPRESFDCRLSAIESWSVVPTSLRKERRETQSHERNFKLLNSSGLKDCLELKASPFPFSLAYFNNP